MSTRSVIGIKQNDTYITVYCHSDGYPEYNGTILDLYYNQPELAKELISLGDLSIIKPKLAADENVVHNFDVRANGVTVAYHRDRGEKYQKPEKFNSLKEIIDYYSNCSYLYVFDEQWKYLYCHSKNAKLTPVKLDEEYVSWIQDMYKDKE